MFFIKGKHLVKNDETEGLISFGSDRVTDVILLITQMQGE